MTEGRKAAPASEPPALVLASASPRRVAILEMLGLAFEVCPAGVSEEVRYGEGPRELAERLAREKVEAVARERGDALVLGGDTVVAVDDDILGKPSDEEHAVRMLLELAGRTHRVHTALALATPDGRTHTRTADADVSFRAFGADTARSYASSGDPLDKAGGYGIQGKGSALVSAVSGDYYAVVGLPVAAFVELLERAGWLYRFGDPLRPA